MSLPFLFLVHFSKNEQLKTLFPQRKDQLLEAIRQGNYQPSAILGVEIPKGNGKTRLLGVPTTTDRVLQQAVSQGWLNYFRGTNIMGKLRDLDGWLRNRLLYCIWHD
jgi:hypothetical protein